MAFPDLDRVLRLRDDAVIGEGASEELIRSAEHELGVKFPSDLRHYLRQFGSLEVGHIEFFGLGGQIPEYRNLTRVTASERTESGCPLPRGLVPLLNDGGGNLYCVAVDGESLGSILFWNHEAGPDQEPEIIASSLEAWLLDILRDLDNPNT